MKNSELPSNQINGKIKQQNDLIFIDCNQQSFIHFKAFYSFILQFPWGVKSTKWNELGNQVECSLNTQRTVANLSDKFILAAYVYFITFHIRPYFFYLHYGSQILLVQTYRLPNLLLPLLCFSLYFIILIRNELQKYNLLKIYGFQPDHQDKYSYFQTLLV